MQRFPMQSRLAALVASLVAALVVSACSGPPRDTYVQWVARDAWSTACAEKAMVERFEAKNGRWKVKGEVWVVDVKVTFKLGNDCDEGLLGKRYKAYESVEFEKNGLEMSRCKKGDAEGWALPGKEAERCWTGPQLLAPAKG